MIVVGATWTLMYNADVLLGALGAAVGRMRGLAPVLKMAIAYPLRSLFRTGVTLAMFTLVVFTLVVGATTTGAFANAFNDVGSFGGGFDVRADDARLRADRRHAGGRSLARPGLRPATSASSRASRRSRSRPGSSARGGKRRRTSSTALDDTFLRHTTYGSPPGRAGYGRRRGLERDPRRTPTWRSSTRSSCRAARTGTSRRCPTSS